MCEPTTIAYAAAAILAAGSAYVSAENNANAAEANAEIQEVRAKDAIDRSQVEEDAKRREIAALLGTQRSQLAANGVELDSGSASDLLADTAQLGELDALTIRSNGFREAFGERSGAAISRSSADNTRTQGALSAGSSLINGATKTQFAHKQSKSGIK